ncbi:MAG: GNAT family N-acetyltransferase [Chloroflexota bacterium]
MIIRKATPKDAEILSLLTAEVQELHAEAEPEIFISVKGDFAVEHIKVMMTHPENQYFIGEADQEAIGYVLVSHIQSPQSVFSFPRDYLHIDHISVPPLHQGNGNGKQLIAFVFVLAKEMKVTEVTLGSWGFNQSAHRFFEKQGFETYQIRMRKKIVLD